MNEGVQHAKDARYDEAILAFQRVLEHEPANARVLSELSWAAFKKGDLALAMSAGERAVASADNVNVKGAALYNLGRIAEAQGREDDAVESYEQSLRVRPHKTVLARLSGISPSAAAAVMRDLPALDDLRPAWSKPWTRASHGPVWSEPTSSPMRS